MFEFLIRFAESMYLQRNVLFQNFARLSICGVRFDKPVT